MQEREARFKSQPATLIRLADKTCNVRDITRDPPASWSVERQVAYFAWAEGVVAGLRGVHTKLESEFDDALLSARLGTLPSSMGG
jgi:guanosine-3',5'-bis(diphosphate) 3'-pyrophosphohydrolase